MNKVCFMSRCMTVISFLSRYHLGIQYVWIRGMHSYHQTLHNHKQFENQHNDFNDNNCHTNDRASDRVWPKRENCAAL